MIVSIVGLCLISVFGIFLLVQESIRNSAYEDAAAALDIQFKNATQGILEYGDPFNPHDFVLSSTSEYEAEGYIDSYRVGDYTVEYTLKDVDEKYNQEIEKTVSYDISVIDTKAPIIDLKKDKITITQGDEYEVTDNIERIADEVDGLLAESDIEEVDSYTIQSDLDVDKPGEYKVEIIAIDKNELKTEKSFTVVVEEEKEEVKEEEKKEEETTEETNDVAEETYNEAETPTEPSTAPSAPSNDSSSTPSSTPTPAPTPAPTPKPTPTPAPAPYNPSWSGPVLTPSAGRIQGPSGEETYYNLNMDYVVKGIANHGVPGDYWIRDDGVKMYGNYVICACAYSVHPKYSTVQTSLGTGICADTGGFAYSNPYQIDIATNW